MEFGAKMKVSREQATENRARVVEIAARLFRERGFDGIGIADLMKEAGLTHGAFYGQFSGKTELIAEACTAAIDKTLARWGQLGKAGDGKALGALTRAYLSEEHITHAGEGCVYAAVGADVARQEAPVRQAVTKGVKATFDLLAGFVPGVSKAAKRQRALSHFSAMVGAMVLARAVDDPALSTEILRAVATDLRADPEGICRWPTTPQNCSISRT